jgi:hypothetical protein
LQTHLPVQEFPFDSRRFTHLPVQEFPFDSRRFTHLPAQEFPFDSRRFDWVPSFVEGNGPYSSALAASSSVLIGNTNGQYGNTGGVLFWETKGSLFVFDLAGVRVIRGIKG